MRIGVHVSHHWRRRRRRWSGTLLTTTTIRGNNTTGTQAAVEPNERPCCRPGVCRRSNAASRSFGVGRRSRRAVSIAGRRRALFGTAGGRAGGRAVRPTRRLAAAPASGSYMQTPGGHRRTTLPKSSLRARETPLTPRLSHPTPPPPCSRARIYAKLVNYFFFHLFFFSSTRARVLLLSHPSSPPPPPPPPSGDAAPSPRLPACRRRTSLFRIPLAASAVRPLSPSSESSAAAGVVMKFGVVAAE